MKKGLRALCLILCLLTAAAVLPGAAAEELLQEPLLVLTTDARTGRAEKTADQRFDLLNEFRFVFEPSEGFEINLAGSDRLTIRLESDHQLIELVYEGRVSEQGLGASLSVEVSGQSASFALEPSQAVEAELLVSAEALSVKVSQGDAAQSRTLSVPVQNESARLTFILQKREGGEGTCSAIIREAEAAGFLPETRPSGEDEASSGPADESPYEPTEQLWSPWHYLFLGLAVAAGLCLFGLIFLLVRKKFFA